LRIHCCREGPPLTVTCQSSDLLPGLHPPGSVQVSFERNKNTSFCSRQHAYPTGLAVNYRLLGSYFFGVCPTPARLVRAAGPVSPKLLGRFFIEIHESSAPPAHGPPYPLNNDRPPSKFGWTDISKVAATGGQGHERIG